ncbi:MAG: ComF family protein [Colwellia sp.]|nr:ComF family protein [Colwellia sp.]MCW8866402.1 ComF family protein [Colwellia sp.]MCW9082374.1 ComF family protein [Colwellia sp.]
MEWQTCIQNGYQKLLLQIGQCDLCGNPTVQQPLICDACLTDLPLFKQDIVQGDLLNWPAINRELPNISFDHLFCLSPYLPPFSHWLSEFKYQGRFELAHLFANLLANAWQASSLSQTTPAVDLVVSVPLHINKWQSRGYNQAHLIAKHFSKALQLPYHASAIRRVKKNTSQVGKTGQERRKNLARAFSLDPSLVNGLRHIILIDDVVTTGSTASEITKLLKNAGVTKVTLVTVCLTLPKV